jgi:hypothetical protein
LEEGPEDLQEKVPVKKMKLAEKGAEKKKTKRHVPADKTEAVEREIAEEVGDGGEEGEEVGKLEEVVENVAAQAQKVAVKKGHSGGGKKRKKTMGVEKEEEEFPTTVENLYSAKATTLIALEKLSMGQGGEKSGVTTRSKEKLQPASQVDKSKKRRGT